MNNLLKKLENIRLNSIHKHLDSNFHLSHEEKIEATFLYFNTNQPLKKRRRYCIDPFDYETPVGRLKHLSESELIIKEMTHLFEEDDIELPLWLHRKVLSSIKAALTGAPSLMELYISERNAQKIFGVSHSRLHLHRKSGLLKSAKQNESYCYPWTQLKELFG